MSNPQALRRKLAKACQTHQYEDALDALLHLSLELLLHTAVAAPRNQLVLIHTAIIGSAATPSDALAESLQPLLDRVSAIDDYDVRDAVILHCIRHLALASSVFVRAGVEADTCHDARSNATH